MRHKKVKLSVILLLCLGLTGLQAQEAIPATGGNASGSGGSASYSVGQVVYTTNTGTNGSVAQGVQQPFEISVVSGIEDDKGINLSCSTYPNPVNNYLTLKVEEYDYANLSYQLFNINGKLLENKKITDSETVITLAQFANGTYFLKISNNETKIKTFKIIKN